MSKYTTYEETGSFSTVASAKNAWKEIEHEDFPTNVKIEETFQNLKM